MKKCPLSCINYRKRIYLNAGYSLLEIIIAVCILSFGLLGFVQAQLLALRTQQAACLQSMAQARLIAMAEALQACVINQCTASAINHQIAYWNNDNVQLLPHGHGQLSAQNGQQLIHIQWQAAQNSAFAAQAKLLVPVLNS